MSALATAPTLFDQRHGGPTLDDVIVEAWASLATGAAAACPLCDGELSPQSDGHRHTVAGRCGSCGCLLT